MKAVKILLRLTVLSGALIVLSIPRPFVAQPAGCGSYAYQYTQDCAYSTTACPQCLPGIQYYPVYAWENSYGDDITEPVLMCEGYEAYMCTYQCVYYDPEPISDPSQCCIANGGSCNGGTCCSGLCHCYPKSTYGTCGACYPNGSTCACNSDCCSDDCQIPSGQSSGQCVQTCQNNVNGSCASEACCSPLLCYSGNETCLTCFNNGYTCSSNSQCCSGDCSGGTCASACLANGSQCTSASQCCGGGCSPQGGCFTCGASGSGCNAGWQCCSGLCGGSTGHICE
jgi:hypothetical protein